MVFGENPLEDVFCLGVGVLSLRYRTLRMPETDKAFPWLLFGA